VDRRSLIGMATGLIGLALGTSAAIFSIPLLAVVAGLLALTAGGLATWSTIAWRRAQQGTAVLEQSVQDLTQQIQAETRQRAEVEAKLSSRIHLTALRRGTEGNALTDDESGLLSEGYFTVALDARIATARRNLKPVAVVLLEVIAGLDTPQPQPAEPTDVARCITTTVRQSDTVCRLLDGGYALVLEDTTENGAIWTAERIRRALEADIEGLTLWAGVACYPAHGLSTEEILDRADLALDMAREWRQDRIEIATLDS
jgi:GGDEF domain-containing protein